MWEALHQEGPFENVQFYTASRVPSIVGCGYDSPQKTWEYMTRTNKPTENVHSQKAKEHGKSHESVALADFREQFADSFGVCGCVVGMVVHPTVEYLAASADYIAWDNRNGALINVEIKCPYSASLPQTINAVKDNYLVQTQVQMMCLPLQRTLLFVWKCEEDGTVGRVCFELPAYPEFQRWLEQQVKEFKRAVEQRRPVGRLSSHANAERRFHLATLRKRARRLL